MLEFLQNYIWFVVKHLWIKWMSQLILKGRAPNWVKNLSSTHSDVKVKGGQWKSGTTNKTGDKIVPLKATQ